MPKISIVIPAYNAENVLTETLDSVLAQTFQNWELVLIDDGSKDGTFELACKYASNDSRIRPIKQKNGGVANARNRGISEISNESEAVIFLDHDDLWRKDALEVLWHALEANHRAVGAHALALLVNTESRGRTFTPHNGTTVDWRRRKMVRTFGMVRTIECSRTEPTTFNIQVYDGCICTPGLLLVRQKYLRAIGEFDSTVEPCDDWDMWVRLSLLGDVIFVDDVLLNWCVYGGNASLNKEGMGNGVSQIRRKMFTLPGMSADQRLLAHTRYKKMYASVERYNAKDCASWAIQLFRKGNFQSAMNVAVRAFQKYLLYLMLSIAWGPELDRGPIPRRLKDVDFPAELSDKESTYGKSDDSRADIGSHSIL